MKPSKFNRNTDQQIFIFFLLIFFFIQLFDVFDWAIVSFIAKNIFLIIFLTYNIIVYRKHNPARWLLNPAVLASLITFLLNYCLTNYVYFIPGSEDEKQMFRLLGRDYLFFFNKGMNVVIVGAFAMWIGYKSNLGVKLYNFILRFPINFKKYFSSSFEPNLPSIYIILVLVIAARVYAIDLGIYGYSQSPDKITASIGIVNILLSFSELTSICLLTVSFAYFSNRKNFKYKFTFLLILITEIIFGILSGLKSNVVMPIILSFITYYLVNRKINKTFILTAFLLITLAYIIIEPFRILRMRDASFQSSPTNIASTMMDAYLMNQSSKIVPGNENALSLIISRNSYLIATARSIQYIEVHGLGALDPDFLEKIYTIPLQAFIPRLFWTGKPIEDTGRWFAVRVWGITAPGSVAMTPFGFLYFAGGLVFIFFGFLFIGILQKTLWQFYLAGGGQLLIFLALLSTVVLIDSAYNGIIVTWLRNIPLFILLQSLILKKTNKFAAIKN